MRIHALYIETLARIEEAERGYRDDAIFRSRVRELIMEFHAKRLELGVSEEKPPSELTMHPVESSAVRAIGYDDRSGTLQVEFTSGTTYQYKNVDPITWVRFKNAESKGSFVAAHLRNKYETAKVERPAPEVDIAGQLAESVAGKNAGA